MTCSLILVLRAWFYIVVRHLHKVTRCLRVTCFVSFCISDALTLMDVLWRRQIGSVMSFLKVASNIHFLVRNAEVVCEDMVKAVSTSDQVILEHLHFALNLMQEGTCVIPV